MHCRLAFILRVLVALGVSFCVEQPTSSLLWEMRSMEAVFRDSIILEFAQHLGDFGAMSLKPIKTPAPLDWTAHEGFFMLVLQMLSEDPSFSRFARWHSIVQEPMSELRLPSPRDDNQARHVPWSAPTRCCMHMQELEPCEELFCGDWTEGSDEGEWKLSSGVNFTLFITLYC